MAVGGAKITGRNDLAAFDFPNGTLVLSEAGTKRRASLQSRHLAWIPARKAMMDATHGRLVDAVRRGRGVIDPEYVRADREAIRNQSAHRLLVDIVVIAGALTILAGIAPLIGTLTQSTMRVGTTISNATAVIAVLLGIFVGLQGRWLLTRHRAERPRFLLFEALLEPALEESLNLDRWSERLTERSAAIARLQSAEMTAWLARDRIVESADDGVPSGVYLDELVRTYVLDLIDSQPPISRAERRAIDRCGRTSAAYGTVLSCRRTARAFKRKPSHARYASAFAIALLAANGCATCATCSNTSRRNTANGCG